MPEFGNWNAFRTDFCSTPGWLSLFPFFRKYNKLFKPACAAHDWFYHNAYSLDMTQLECDLEFFYIMIDIAQEQPSEEQEEALKAAVIYYKGVRIGGHRGFKEAWEQWQKMRG